VTRMRLCNVLVIGSGAAGLRAAIAAHRAGTEVLVMGKRARLDAHTVLASGGINAALGTRDPEDSWQQHFGDTVREGYFLSDPRVVETTVREAPGAVEELAAWGGPFARTDDGRLDQRFFGAHRWRRTCYVGDYSGRAILRTLVAKVDELAIPILEGQYVSRLLVPEPGYCQSHEHIRHFQIPSELTRSIDRVPPIEPRRRSPRRSTQGSRWTPVSGSGSPASPGPASTSPPWSVPSAPATASRRSRRPTA